MINLEEKKSYVFFQFFPCTVVWTGGLPFWFSVGTPRAAGSLGLRASYTGPPRGTRFPGTTLDNGQGGKISFGDFMKKGHIGLVFPELKFQPSGFNGSASVLVKVLVRVFDQTCYSWNPRHIFRD